MTAIPPDRNPRLYNILSLPHGASLDEVKRSFKELALRYHPDKNTGTDGSLTADEAAERFKEISSAYQYLSCKERKDAYDARYSFTATLDSFYAHYKKPAAGAERFKTCRTNTKPSTPTGSRPSGYAHTPSADFYGTYARAQATTEAAEEELKRYQSARRPAHTGTSATKPRREKSGFSSELPNRVRSTPSRAGYSRTETFEETSTGKYTAQQQEYFKQRDRERDRELARRVEKERRDAREKELERIKKEQEERHAREEARRNYYNAAYGSLNGVHIPGISIARTPKAAGDNIIPPLTTQRRTTAPSNYNPYKAFGYDSVPAPRGPETPRQEAAEERDQGSPPLAADVCETFESKFSPKSTSKGKTALLSDDIAADGTDNHTGPDGHRQHSTSFSFIGSPREQSYLESVIKVGQRQAAAARAAQASFSLSMQQAADAHYARETTRIESEEEQERDNLVVMEEIFERRYLAGAFRRGLTRIAANEAISHALEDEEPSCRASILHEEAGAWVAMSTVMAQESVSRATLKSSQNHSRQCLLRSALEEAQLIKKFAEGRAILYEAALGARHEIELQEAKGRSVALLVWHTEPQRRRDIGTAEVIQRCGLLSLFSVRWLILNEAESRRSIEAASANRWGQLVLIIEELKRRLTLETAETSERKELAGQREAWLQVLTARDYDKLAARNAELAVENAALAAANRELKLALENQAATHASELAKLMNEITRLQAFEEDVRMERTRRELNKENADRALQTRCLLTKRSTVGTPRERPAMEKGLEPREKQSVIKRRNSDDRMPEQGRAHSVTRIDRQGMLNNSLSSYEIITAVSEKERRSRASSSNRALDHSSRGGHVNAAALSTSPTPSTALTDPVTQPDEMFAINSKPRGRVGFSTPLRMTNRDRLELSLTAPGLSRK